MSFKKKKVSAWPLQLWSASVIYLMCSTSPMNMVVWTLEHSGVCGSVTDHRIILGNPGPSVIHHLLCLDFPTGKNRMCCRCECDVICQNYNLLFNVGNSTAYITDKVVRHPTWNRQDIKKAKYRYILQNEENTPIPSGTRLIAKTIHVTTYSY